MRVINRESNNARRLNHDKNTKLCLISEFNKMDYGG
jgi:hypothetical protein